MIQVVEGFKEVTSLKLPESPFLQIGGGMSGITLLELNGFAAISEAFWGFGCYMLNQARGEGVCAASIHG